jgi:hypothetical protein
MAAMAANGPAGMRGRRNKRGRGECARAGVSIASTPPKRNVVTSRYAHNVTARSIALGRRFFHDSSAAPNLSEFCQSVSLTDSTKSAEIWEARL